MTFLHKIYNLTLLLIKHYVSSQYKISCINYKTNHIKIYNNSTNDYINIHIIDLFLSNEIIKNMSSIDAYKVGVEYGRFKKP